jgi:putative tributyrin esterase
MSFSVETLKSECLRADVSFAVILPEGEGPFPVLYDLHGLLSDEKPYDPAPTSRSFFEKLSFRKYQRVADETGTAIVKVNGGRGWYIDSPRIKNSQYESHIIRELIPHVESSFPRIGSRLSLHPSKFPSIGNRGISGHSMGGMGVVNLLCRYPNLFSVGAIHCASLRFMPPDDHRGSFIEDLMSDEELRAAFPDNFLNALLRDDLKLRITVGKEDKPRIVRENRALHEFLAENNSPHFYEETPGGHEYAPHGWVGMVWAAQQLGASHRDAE